MNALTINHLKSPHQIFVEEGILFYPSIFEGDELARLRDACDNVLAEFRDDHERSGAKDVNSIHSMRHLNDKRWHKGNDEQWKIIMETVADPRCLGPVEQIFRGPSLFRCTSLFFNPRDWAMEGNWHRDIQFIVDGEDDVKKHLEDPERRANPVEGVQFQISLIDNDDIEYVPFSPGRYDSPEEYHVRCADNRSHCTEPITNALRVHQRPGDAVIFNANGLHRGRYYSHIPRRTLMLTYTPRDRVYYDYFSHQPWMLEPGHFDGLSPRTRAYFEDFAGAYGDQWRENMDANSKAGYWTKMKAK